MPFNTLPDQPQLSPLTQHQRRLNRRQRKKNRLGEFQEWGLSICAQLVGCDTEATMDAFIDAFLAQVEARDLMFGSPPSRPQARHFSASRSVHAR